jgi:predicted HicB family RNase H-like nuclease
MANYQKTKDEYLKNKVDTFVVRVPKGQKQIIQDFAKLNGMSLNSFVVSLINSAVPELNKNSDK